MFEVFYFFAILIVFFSFIFSLSKMSPLLIFHLPSSIVVVDVVGNSILHLIPTRVQIFPPRRLRANVTTYSSSSPPRRRHISSINNHEQCGKVFAKPFPSIRRHKLWKSRWERLIGCCNFSQVFEVFLVVQSHNRVCVCVYRVCKKYLPIVPFKCIWK